MHVFDPFAFSRFCALLLGGTFLAGGVCLAIWAITDLIQDIDGFCPVCKKIRGGIEHLGFVAAVVGSAALLMSFLGMPEQVSPKEVVQLEHGWAFRDKYVPYTNYFPAPGSGGFEFWVSKTGRNAGVTQIETKAPPRQIACRIIDRAKDTLAVMDDGRTYSVKIADKMQEEARVQMDLVFMTSPSDGVDLPQSYWEYQEDNDISTGHLVEWVAN